MNLVDMSLPPNDFLLLRINALYGSRCTFNNVYISAEGVQPTTLYGCDSKVKLIAIPGRGLSGTALVYFSKVNFDSFLAGQFLDLERSTYFDTDDLLPMVLLKLGINLRRMDIVSDIIKSDATSAKIRISSACPTYRGVINVRFTSAAPSLSTRLRKLVLDGFHIPQEVT